MWCLVFWCLDLACTNAIFDFLGTCFPLRCNNIYAMGWLHILSSFALAQICLTIVCLMIRAEHARDIAFNGKWKAKNREFDSVAATLPQFMSRNPEMDHLREMWQGMFKGNYDRGKYQPVFIVICGVVAAVNLALFVMAVIVWVKNCRGGSPYKNDWQWNKGRLGFFFVGGISLLFFAVLSITLREVYEVIDTEMIYETHFPFCTRDRHFINRFCKGSREEINGDTDLCMDIKKAVKYSYLCHNFPLKIRSRVIALVVVFFHFLMCLGYAQMAYRPWGWKKLKQKMKNEDMRKERLVKLHEVLLAKAPAKLQIAQEKKAARLADMKRKEEAIAAERKRLEQAIKIKNAKRRLNRRAERQFRKMTVGVKAQQVEKT